MSDMRSEMNKPSEIRWIVGGAVAILVAGMVAVTAASTLSADATASIAALGGMISLGLTGLFGLHKLNESQQKAMAENTKETKKVVSGVEALGHRLNGELDARIRDSVAIGIAQFRAGLLLDVREAVKETLAEWEQTQR